MALFALFGWHLGEVLRLLWPALIDGHPVVQNDYTFHQAGAYVARAAWEETGGFRAYNAMMGAGMPHGGIPAASNQLVLVLTALVPGEVPRVFAGVVGATFLLFPTALVAAAGVGGVRPWGRVVVALLAIGMFWGFEFGKLRLLAWGMYAQLAAYALVPWLAQLLWRGRSWGAFGVLALGLWVHTTFPALAALVLGVVFLLGEHRASTVLVGAAYGALLLLTGPTLGLFGGGANVIEADVFFQWPLDVALGVMSGVPGAPWVFTLALLLLPSRGREGAAQLLLAALVTVLALSVAVPFVGALQPGRFQGLPAIVLLVPVVQAVDRLRVRGRPWGLIALAALGAHAMPPRPLSPLLTLDGRTLAIYAPLFEGLRSRPGRVLLEDVVHGVEPNLFGRTLLPSLLPWILSRPVLCPPYSDYRLLHREARLLAGTLGGAEIEALAPAEIRAWIDRYAVGDIVAWHPATLRALSATPGLTLTQTTHELFRFEVDEVAPYAQTAEVRLHHVGIEVREASTSTTVIAAHFDPRLATHPPLPVRVVPVPGDPIGFIAVDNGPVRDFTLSWKGRLRDPVGSSPAPLGRWD